MIPTNKKSNSDETLLEMFGKERGDEFAPVVIICMDSYNRRRAVIEMRTFTFVIRDLVI